MAWDRALASGNPHSTHLQLERLENEPSGRLVFGVVVVLHQDYVSVPQVCCAICRSRS